MFGSFSEDRFGEYCMKDRLNQHIEEHSLSRKLLYSFGVVVLVVTSFLSSVLLVELLIGFVNLASLQNYVSGNIINISVSIIVYVFMLGVMLGLMKLFRMAMPTKNTIGLKFIEWSDIGLALLGILAYVVIMAILLFLTNVLLPWVDMSQTQEVGLTPTFDYLENSLIFILLVFIGPFFEELVFRGYLHGKLRQYGVSVVSTILVTSLLFALAHMQWNVAIVTFGLGLVMSSLREYSGSIWPGFLVHMAKNYLAYYLLFIYLN